MARVPLQKACRRRGISERVLFDTQRNLPVLAIVLSALPMMLLGGRHGAICLDLQLPPHSIRPHRNFGASRKKEAATQDGDFSSVESS
jgi:hypothetical protein